MVASPLRYSLLAGLVLALCAGVVAEGTGLRLGTALLLLPFVGGPAWVTLAYLAAVRRAHAAAMLRQPVWWSWAVGNPLPAMAAAFGLGALSAWAVLMRLLTEGWAGWLWIAATAVVLYPVAWAWARGTDAFRTYARLRPVLLRSPPAAAMALTVAWALGQGIAGPNGGSWAAHVAAEPRLDGGRALFGALVEGMAVVNGTRVYAEAWVEGQDGGTLVALWRLAGTFVQFWLLAGVFSAGLIPAVELRRILRPSDADDPASPGPRRLAFATAILALLAWSTVHFAVAIDRRAEAWLAPMTMDVAPRLATPRGSALPPMTGLVEDAPRLALAPTLPTPAALRLAIEREQLGELLCASGTFSAVEALDAEMAGLLSAQERAVRTAVQDGFDVMRGNVDAYLDWHYTLTTRYAEIVATLFQGGADFLDVQGTVERYAAGAIGAEFAGHLGQGAPFVPLDAALGDMAQVRSRIDALSARRDGLLAACDVALPSDAGPLLLRMVQADLSRATVRIEALALEERVTGAGLVAPAGALTGVVLGKAVTSKLVAGAGFKAASTVAAKLAVAKAGGWVGGAAAGAGTGSLLCAWSGPAASVCAAAGGLVGGLAVGLAIDKLLVELEEAVGRDDYRTEILAALDATEREVMDALFPPE